jgi:lysine 6-dehydrogenase
LLLSKTFLRISLKEKKMAITYAVLGSGMQGTAGGYFLARWGNASRVVMADIDLSRAEKAAAHINRLMGQDIAIAAVADARSADSLQKLFSGVQAVMSATSYEYNHFITEQAIAAKVHLVDLGGNTDVVKGQLKLHEKALAQGISIVPDCGLAPGLGNTLAALGISRLDQCEDVQVRCGGLPQTPRPPLDYKLVFNIKGLTNEYFGKAWVLRNNQIETIDTFSELETLDFDAPVGRCEAFTTTGGTSTAPWTFQGKVRNYVYKTVRYPGHHAKMKCMMDLGLLDTAPVTLESGAQVAPRDVFHAVVPSKIDFPEDKDLVVLRATCSGTKNGKPTSIQFDVMDFHDDKTGFTAMERTTAYPAALVLIHAAANKAKKGVASLEVALDNESYFKDLVEQAFPVKVSIKSSGDTKIDQTGTVYSSL